VLPHAAINLRPRGRGGSGREGRGKEGGKRVERDVEKGKVERKMR